MKELSNIEELRLEINKEISLNGQATCEWDEGFDAALRLVMQWINSLLDRNDY